MNIVQYSRELEYWEADLDFKILPRSIADSLLTQYYWHTLAVVICFEKALVL